MQDAKAEGSGQTSAAATAAGPQVPGPEGTPSRPGKGSRRFTRSRRSGISLTVILTLVVLALGLGFLTLAYTGKSIRLPTWAVAEIETRLNESLDAARLQAGTAVSIGSVEVAVGNDFVPELRLADLRLITGAGRSLLASDETGTTCEDYGVWQEKSMYGKTYMGIQRATFLIGGDGRVARVWPKVSVKGHADEVLAAVKAL